MSKSASEGQILPIPTTIYQLTWNSSTPVKRVKVAEVSLKKTEQNVIEVS